VKTLICPADSRQAIQLPGNQWGGVGNVAFTGYLGAAGVTADFNSVNYNTGAPTNSAQIGILFWGSKTRMGDVTDGTSNTLFVGERPPSADLYYGWWFAGAGWDGSGVGDVVLGAREVNYAVSLGSPCGASNVGFQAGKISNTCDQAH